MSVSGEDVSAFVGEFSGSKEERGCGLSLKGWTSSWRALCAVLATVERDLGVEKCLRRTASDESEW